MDEQPLSPRTVAHELLLLTLLAAAPEGTIERFEIIAGAFTGATLYDGKVSDGAIEGLDEHVKRLAARARLWRAGA